MRARLKLKGCSEIRSADPVLPCDTMLLMLRRFVLAVLCPLAMSAYAATDRPPAADASTRSSPNGSKAGRTAPARPGNKAGPLLWRELPSGQAGIPNFIPPSSLSPLVRAVSRSVVNISSEVSASETATKDIESALGSGLIIAPEGYVLTNSHVVERATRIRVKLADTREFLADVVGRDASTDIALLKLQKVPPDLPFGYLGDSDKLNVGD